MQKLRDQLARITDLNHAAAILEWDQETYMPEGGAASRARQVATLRTMAHELLTSDLTAHALDAARPETDVDQDLVRITRRDLEKATRVPSSLINAMSEAQGHAKGAWQKARATNQFGTFAPHLERIVDLSLEHAEALGYENEPYDALLDIYEPDMKTRDVWATFAALKDELVPLVQELTQSGASPQKSAANNVTHGHFPHDQQWDFGLRVARDLGYDLTRGRQDVSAHPFSTTFSIDDVRITTRIDESFFNPGFFGTLHEAGHAMYEQGIDPALERTPLADGTSLGIHESQSRMWENQVGRSLPFWEHYMPAAREAFPVALADVSAEMMFRAVNRVEPSLVRVEADEVTYNLHIMLRFELEQAMLAGDVTIKDLPTAWNDRMEAWLGIRPETDTDGVLQDIHWSLGALGYFPTYALGNLMSAQLFETMERDIPDRDAHIRRGDFAPILAWLRRNVHVWGRRRTATEILEATCGSGLDAAPWIRYVKTKYTRVG